MTFSGHFESDSVSLQTPPPYLNPCQYKCCSRLRDNVYFEIKVMSFQQTLLFLFLSLTVAQDDSPSLRMWMTWSLVWPPQYTLDVCNNNSREIYYNAYQITRNHYIIFVHFHLSSKINHSDQQTQKHGIFGLDSVRFSNWARFGKLRTLQI